MFFLFSSSLFFKQRNEQLNQLLVNFYSWQKYNRFEQTFFAEIFIKIWLHGRENMDTKYRKSLAPFLKILVDVAQDLFCHCYYKKWAKLFKRWDVPG